MNSMSAKRLRIPCQGNRKRNKRKWIKTAYSGSYTVESVFLFPILLFLIAFILHLSIGLCGNVNQAAEDVQTVRQLDTGKMFLDAERLRSIKELLVK